MSAYATRRSLRRQAARRESCMPMVAQTTNPKRFWQWLLAGLWGLVLAGTAVVGAMAILALFFGIE